MDYQERGTSICVYNIQRNHASICLLWQVQWFDVREIDCDMVSVVPKIDRMGLSFPYSFLLLLHHYSVAIHSLLFTGVDCLLA